MQAFTMVKKGPYLYPAGKCKPCRSEEARIQSQCKRNRKISKLISWPVTTAIVILLAGCWEPPESLLTADWREARAYQRSCLDRGVAPRVSLEGAMLKVICHDQ